MDELRLRPSQKQILAYRGGWMGISAVPGAGKTFTLSRLAADILLRGELNADQEVLIVTLVNSAVDNFAGRIAANLKDTNRLPGWGYRVRTLHGLSHDIVRERPGAVGLAEDFQIIDESEAGRILDDVAAAWLRTNPDLLAGYLKSDLDEGKLAWLKRDKLPDLVQSIALATTRYAKDRELTPEALRSRLDSLPLPLPLAEMGWALYADYQRALHYRGAVDFDDLIRLALLVLKLDDRLVERLRRQWPYILEDEAQDSSRLQEEILRRLAGSEGNWVRVGDPNQAIYETFTTASPEYLLRFREEPGVLRRDLPESGRSAPGIIRLANHLIQWSQGLEEPDPLASALALPEIIATAPDDPQPNPADLPELITLYERQWEAQKEKQTVAQSVANWFKQPGNQQKTLAVLVSRNDSAYEMVEALKSAGVEVVDTLLKNTSATRAAASALSEVLHWLAEPHHPSLFVKAYQAWRKAGLPGAAERPLVDRAARHLSKLSQVEDFIAPLAGGDWLEQSGLERSEPPVYTELATFRELACRWQAAAILPVDQLVLTLAQDIFSEPADLAVAHKLAALIHQRAEAHPDWQIDQLSNEVAEIARNSRRFSGFSKDDTNFNPENYKGKAVVSTLHKAKGLEWDRVYFLSANNYDFPSGELFDQFISEKWFVRDELNLEAEALAQIKAALSTDEYDYYEPGQASRASRAEYARERLRLLYVGITRAKSELVITWNSGQKGRAVPARAFQELIDFWGRTDGPQ
jgi:DNA helicase-2/ATP-dependent DNA helicase PcrA